MQFTEFKEYTWDENRLRLRYPEGIAIVEVITEEIVRIWIPEKSEEYHSAAIEGDKKQPVSATLETPKPGYLTLKTECLEVRIAPEFRVDILDREGHMLCEDYRGKRVERPSISEKQEKFLVAEGHAVRENLTEENARFCVKTMTGSEKFYGLGDKTGFLNKRSYEFVNWNTDNPKAHTEAYEALYKSIPFLITLKDEGVYGLFFDNTNRSLVNLGKESDAYYYYAVSEGPLNYYYIGGKTMKEVVKNYTYLTGRTPLPQRWTLGYHQSRWGYDSAAKVEKIAEKMRECGIPCDCIHLDIDYMRGYRVFTWDEKEFKKPGVLIDELKEQGFHTVCIIDPGVKVDPDYEVYQEGVKNGCFATTPEGEIYVNEVWPGDSVFPDFGKSEVQNWWADKQQFLTDLGVGGVWNDMNEPASFRGPLPDDILFSDEEQTITHAEMHNKYGHLMSRATYEGLKKATGRRPFVITRACYAGTQKYSTVWTGDNQSLWSHLQMAIPQLCNLGLSGIGISGTDVGGFGADTTPELLGRWAQLGAFSPLFRNHSSNGTIYQEPWRFDAETLRIYRKAVELRYELLPYFYDCMKVCEDTGLPAMRPVVLNFENDPECWNLNDEFMIGESLLVAPVVEQGAVKRMVYLPAGCDWYTYDTRTRYEGGQYYIVDAPRDVCPIFVREGAVLPNYEMTMQIGETRCKKLILRAYPGSGEYLHYQDNGLDFAYQNGEYSTYRVVNENGKIVSCETVHEGYPVYEEIIYSEC